MPVFSISLLPSRLHAIALVFLFLGAIASVWVCGFSLVWKLALVLLISVYGAILWRKLYSPSAVNAIQAFEQGDWALLLRDGSTVMASLLPETVMLRYFSSLQFKSSLSKRRFSVLLFPDSCSSCARRLLRKHIVLSS